MPYVNGIYQPADQRSPMERLYGFEEMQAKWQALQRQQAMQQQREQIMREAYQPAVAAQEAGEVQAPEDVDAALSRMYGVGAQQGMTPDALPSAQQAVEGRPAQFDAQAAMTRLYGAGDIEGALKIADIQKGDQSESARLSGSIVNIDDPDNPGVTIAVQPYTRGEGPAYRKLGVAGMTPEARLRMEAKQREEAYKRRQDARSAQFEREKFEYDKTKTAGASGASEDERKAAGWVAQARTATGNMQQVLAENPGADTPTTAEAVGRVVGLDRAVMTEGRQRFVDAASSFSEAALRAATGAGVNADEARQKIEELTPGYFDKPATKQQKFRQLQMYIDSLESRAGRALSTVKAPSAARAPAAQSGAPKPGAIKNGYVYMGGNPADPKSWRKL